MISLSVAICVYVCAFCFKGTGHYCSYYVVVLLWNSLVMEKENNVQQYKIAKPAGIQVKNILFCAQIGKPFPSCSFIFEQDVLCHKVAHSLFSTVYAQITFYIPINHKLKTENVFEER